MPSIFLSLTRTPYTHTHKVMFPIAVYYTVVATGDLKWLASMRPALDAVAEFLAANGLSLNNSDASAPVVYVSPASGLADGQHHAANWYDVILFGHLDAYLAVWGVWSMELLSEMYAALGDTASAARFAAIHQRAVADFNAVFWDASSSSYADWIDVKGNARHYFYVDIPFTAIFINISSPAQTSALLDHYNTRLAGIYSEYNVTAGEIWSPPCNLYPVTDKKEYANDQGPMRFPMYENGGGFFHSAGLYLAALGAAGKPNDAFDSFTTLMNSGFGDIRGWAQQLYWSPNGKPSSLVGFDPLNTAALTVWGFMRATFGVAPTLSSGWVKVNEPAAAMEGARWNVSYLGASVCMKIQGGVTIQCDGSSLF